MTTENKLMNKVTENLLNALKKLKEVKPKITSVSMYDELVSFCPVKTGESTVSMSFTGYLQMYAPQHPKFKGIWYAGISPTEISFCIDNVLISDFNDIDWNAINDKMGYVVGKPLDDESWIKPHKNMELGKIGPYPEDIKKCSCDINQIMIKGCFCGGK